MPPPDRRDEDPPRRPVRRREDDEEDDDDDRPNDGGVSSLIPYRNGMALASYYVGVFSLIPCLGALLGPTAIILGILGLRHAGRNPQAKGKAHAIVGIVLGSLTALGNWGVVIAGIASVALNAK